MLDLFGNNESGCRQRQKIGSVGYRKRDRSVVAYTRGMGGKARNRIEGES